MIHWASTQATKTPMMDNRSSALESVRGRQINADAGAVTA